MARFEETKYQGDRAVADIFKLRVREGIDQLRFDSGVRNFIPNQPVRFPWHAIAADNATGYGLHCRGVFVKWVGEPPQGYDPDGRIFVPILRRSNFLQINVTQMGDWLGARFVVVGRKQEKEV